MGRKIDEIHYEKQNSLIVLLPLWEIFTNRITELFGPLRVRAFNWTHLTSINGLCLIVYFDDNMRQQIPKGCVYQLSLVKSVYTSYFHEKRVIIKDEKGSNMIEEPKISLTYGPNAIEKITQYKIISVGEEIFSQFQQISIDALDEKTPFKKIRNNLFTTIL